MSKSGKNILVTRKLNEEDLKFTKSLGLNPFIQETIKFTYNYDTEKLKQLNEEFRNANWVFTSKNAVKSLKNILAENLIDKNFEKCFAVGERTADKLEALNIESEYPNEHNAESLVEYITENAESKRLVYFKGNLSRKVLKENLEKNNFKVLEVEVYQTELIDFKLDSTNFEAILFYSPSAVRSFKKSIGFENIKSKLFAIGNTTAEELEKYSNRKCYISDKQNTKAFLKFVSENIN